MVSERGKVSKVQKNGLKLWLKYARDRKGATAIEYGLMAALIGVAIIGGAKTLGKGLSKQLNCTANAVASTSPGEKPRFRCAVRPTLSPGPGPKGPKKG